VLSVKDFVSLNQDKRARLSWLVSSKCSRNVTSLAIYAGCGRA
jgi:hypothetical protein